MWIIRDFSMRDWYWKKTREVCREFVSEEYNYSVKRNLSHYNGLAYHSRLQASRHWKRMYVTNNIAANLEGGWSILPSLIKQISLRGFHWHINSVNRHKLHWRMEFFTRIPKQDICLHPVPSLL